MKETSNQSSMANLTKTSFDGKRTSLLASTSNAIGGVKGDWGLLDTERAMYGDRCPKGYEKLKLLGKGGCAIVWLARECLTGKNVALKQFPKPKDAKGSIASAALDPSAKNEIQIGRIRATRRR